VSIQLINASGVTAPNVRESSATPPAPQPIQNRVYTGPEARKLLRMRTNDFYAAIRTGELRSFRPGLRNIRVSQTAINEFIATREIKKSSAVAEASA
jgi:hypothetical protein